MFIVCIVSKLLKLLNVKILLVVTKNIFFKVKTRYGSISALLLTYIYPVIIIKL